MKRNFYLFVLLIPAYFLMSYSSGAPFGYSGSPGDSGRTCATCHAPDGASYMPSINLSGLPVDGYVPGQTYRLHFQLSNTGSTSKYGFEICVENNANQKQGSFAGVGGNTQGIQSNTYVTHTSAGTSAADWLFDWTAPATSQGELKLYYAINLANGNGSSSGDYIQNDYFTIAENTNAITALSDDLLSIYPNPATDFIRLKTTYKFNRIQLVDMQGKSYPVQLQDNQIDVSFLPAGNYFLQVQNEKINGVKQFLKK